MRLVRAKKPIDFSMATRGNDHAKERIKEVMHID
jgi:hypothetical protein